MVAVLWLNYAFFLVDKKKKKGDGGEEEEEEGEEKNIRWSNIEKNNWKRILKFRSPIIYL